MKTDDPRRSARFFGLSWIDWIVLFICLGLLIGLFVPAGNGGGQPRKAQCQNNLMQLTKAVINYRTSHRSAAFPGYAQLIKLSPGLGNAFDRYPDTREIDAEISWAGVLLPSLDQQGMWDKLLSDPKFDWKAPPPLDLFVCPSDVANQSQLSYVANAGMLDIPGTFKDGPTDLTANGVFHDLRPESRGPKCTVSDFKDGASLTLLFSENIQRDPPWTESQSNCNWLTPSPEPSQTNPNAETWYGFLWVYDKENPLQPSKEMFEPIGKDTRTDEEKKGTYASFGTRFARPTGAHPGMFTAAFAGGSVKTISNDIEYEVYQRLVTPDDSKAQDLRNPGERIQNFFWREPLSEDDF